jgi:predicted RNase H-like nuclease (RuvC/YqgF family)
MTTAKTETAKQDFQAKIELHASNIVTLEKEIMAAGDSINELHMNLQRASEDRKADNLDFQTTVADQTATIEVLHKALDKLATYYDAEPIQTTTAASMPLQLFCGTLLQSLEVQSSRHWRPVLSLTLSPKLKRQLMA